MSERKFGQTPSQTVGPYFAYGLTSEQYHYPHRQIVTNRLADPNCPGEHIRICGQVLDGEGNAVDDAMVEIVQPDAEGRFPEAMRGLFRCYGRHGTGTRADNVFEFFTVKPGAAQDGSAPHVSVAVFMRGLLTHCYTRLYFGDEADANRNDHTLQSVPADRRPTLVADREDSPEGTIYRFDIRMQGERETVFFDL